MALVPVSGPDDCYAAAKSSCRAKAHDLVDLERHRLGDEQDDEFGRRHVVLTRLISFSKRVRCPV